MFCQFCGNEMPDDVKFCPDCGAPVENTAPTPEPEATTSSSYGYGEPKGQSQEYSYGAPDQSQQYSYGQTNQSSASYGQQPTYEKKISGTPYLIFSILSTLLCCLPFGVAGIVFSSKINSLQRSGDYEGAKKAAGKARLCIIISVIVAILVNVALAVFTIKASEDGSLEQIVEEVLEDTDEADGESEKANADKDLPSEWESYTVQINDSVIAFPCAIEDIEAAGFKMDENYTSDDFVITAENKYELAWFSDESGNNVMIFMYNDTEEDKKLVDCVASGITVDDYNLEKGDVKVVFPGGVTIGSDIDSVKELYGEPDDEYAGDALTMDTWYGNDGSYTHLCEIDFDVTTGKAVGLVLQNFDL